MSEKIYTIDDIKTALHPVFNSYSIDKAVLFGSYVKGMADEKRCGLASLQWTQRLEICRSYIVC